MRPIKLEIEGLQSYEKKQIIDFEKLTEYGLFGIFGNTGSGKSTVIDAITYAIYGDIVRRDSSTKLDDLLNVNSEKLRVEFTFEIGTDRYLIERAVKCKRGSRELSASKRNIMIKNGDVLCDGHKEIGKEVGNIIGLTMDDFTRSVVLPQGKFSEFLKLSGAERRDMLERIFDLKEYGKRLLDKIRTDKKVLEDKIKSIEDQIKGKGEDLTPEILEAKKKEKKILEGELETLNIKRKEIDVKFKELTDIKVLSEERDHLIDERSELEEKGENIEEDTKRLERAKKAGPINKDGEEHKKLLAEIKSKQENLEVLEERIVEKNSEHKSKKEKAEKLEETIEILQKEIEQVEVSSEENNRSTELSLSLNNYSEAYRDRIRYRDDIAVKEEDERSKIAELEKRLGEKEDLERQLDTAMIIDEKEILIKKYELKDLNLGEIEKLEKDIVTRGVILEKERVKLENLDTTIERKSKELKALRTKERENFASKLAKDLVEGEACPVCGSDHHPNIAVSKGEDLARIEEETERLETSLDEDRKEKSNLKVESFIEKLEDLKKQLGDNSSEKVSLEVSKLEVTIKNLEIEREEQIAKKELLNKDYKEVSERVSSLKEGLSALREGIKSNKKRLEEIIDKFEASRSEIEVKDKNFVVEEFVDTDRVQSYIDDVKDRLKKAENLKNDFKDVETNKKKYLDKVRVVHEELIELDKDKIRLKSEIEQGEKACKNMWDKIEELLVENKFENLEEAVSSLIEEREMEEMDRTINHYKESVGNNKIKLIEVEKKLGKRMYCEDKYRDNKEIIDELSGKIETANKAIGSFEKEIEKIEKEIEAVKDLLEDRAQLTEEHDRYDILSKICAGNKFVEYLSISKIKNISKIASRRLSKISNGRYALTVDLDGSFLIIDNFNGGERRKTATLSGGESFLVSLSLALALSSQIQLKGRIQLEFFFLDEGFGTLDSIVLDRVMTSLETLKTEEKMKVGIITHVEELKDRIPRKILVHPAVSGEKGSTVEMVGL